MEYLREFSSRYRVPDFSRLWNQPDDERDGAARNKQQTSLVRQLESSLVKFQELALWTDPKSSIIALVVIHVVYFYLSFTNSTTLNLTCWSVLLGFVYTTWVNRIWPEIRVPLPEDQRPDSESFTPLNPDCLTAPEVERKMAGVKQRVSSLFSGTSNLRRDNPAKFCALFSVFFLILAYLGSFVTALGLLYYVVVGSLVTPALGKALMRYPAIQCFMETVFTPPTGEVNDETDSQRKKKEIKAEEVVEEPVSSAQYLASFQMSIAETLNQGSAYLTSVMQNQEGSSTPISRSTAVCQHHDDEEDMKEYLPHQTEENEQILEAARADPRRRSRNESTGIESEEEDQLNSLVTGLEEPPSLDDLDRGDDGRSGDPLRSEEDEFLPTAASRRLTREAQPQSMEPDEDAFLRRDSSGSSSSTSDRMSLLRKEVDRSASSVRHRREHHISESASEQEEDFEMISDDELLRSAAVAKDEETDDDDVKRRISQ